MTEKTITRTVYETYDGYEYETKKEAIDHELYRHIADIKKLCDIQQNCINCVLLGCNCSTFFDTILNNNYPALTELLKGDD